MHLGEWHHIHGDFIQIDVQISLEPHRAGQVIHDVGYNGIFLLKMVFFALLIPTLQNRRASLHLLSGTSRLLILLLHLRMLLIDPGDYVEQCLIIHRQDAVSVVDEHVEGQH